MLPPPMLLLLLDLFLDHLLCTSCLLLVVYTSRNTIATTISLIISMKMMTCPQQDQGWRSAILLNFRSSLERPMRHKMYMYLLTKRFCYSSSRIKIYQDGASCKEESIIIRVSVSVDADVKCQRIARYVRRTYTTHSYSLPTLYHDAFHKKSLCNHNRKLSPIKLCGFYLSL